MQIKSGDAIYVRKGLKKYKGFAQSDFDTTEKGVEFDVRLIEKDDAIGEVVTFSTDNRVTQVTDEKYSADPLELPEEPNTNDLEQPEEKNEDE